MSKKGFIVKSVLALGALSLFACSGNSGLAHEGTTEDTNAVLWDIAGTQKGWHVEANSNGKISASKSVESLDGEVVLNSAADDGYARVSIVLELEDENGDTKDLSKDQGICITYSSDFDMDLDLDFGEETNAALQGHVPGFHLYPTKSSEMETTCERWDDLMQDTEKYPVGPEVLTDVRAFEMTFYGEPGTKGNFKLGQVTRYKEPVYRIGTSGTYKVNKSVKSLVSESFLWDEDYDDNVKTGSKDSTAGTWFETYGSEDYGYEIIGFNIVNDKLKGTNVSAWRGLCVSFYSEEDEFKVVLDVSDEKGNLEEDNYWYVDIEGMAERHWVKIAWEAFKPHNPDGESFESAVTHASRIYFKKDEDLKVVIFKVGSYDQCGE